MIKSLCYNPLAFHLMKMFFLCRDRLFPPLKILQEAGVRPGMKILDYGCGPGGFSLAASRLVGEKGFVYAVDIHPLATQSVQKLAAKYGLKNIKTILQDGSAFLQSFKQERFDMILLYDILHGLSQPRVILAALHRVLRSEGVLSVSDHHIKKASLLLLITDSALYRFIGQSQKTMQFKKNDISRGST